MTTKRKEEEKKRKKKKEKKEEDIFLEVSRKMPFFANYFLIYKTTVHYNISHSFIPIFFFFFFFFEKVYPNRLLGRAHLKFFFEKWPTLIQHFP